MTSVTISANGFGIAVRPVESNAPAVTLTDSGAPIVISEFGVPLIVDGYVPPVDFNWQMITLTAGEEGQWIGFSDGGATRPQPGFGSISGQPSDKTDLLALYDDLNTGNIIAFFEGNYVVQMQGIQVSFGGFVLTSDDVRLEMGNTLVRFPGLPGFMQDGETYQVLFGFNLEEMQALASDDGAPLLADNGTYVETYDGRSTA